MCSYLCAYFLFMMCPLYSYFLILYMNMCSYLCAYFLFMMCPLYSYDIIYEHVQLFMCLLLVFVYDEHVPYFLYSCIARILYMNMCSYLCAYFLFMMCPLYSQDIIYEHVQLFMCLLFVYDVSTVQLFFDIIYEHVQLFMCLLFVYDVQL